MTSLPEPRGDLVIGAAYGYDEEKLAPFVQSLRRTGYSGTIALVVTKAQARRFAGSALLSGVELLVVPIWRPAIPDVFHKRITAAVWLPLGVLTWCALLALRLLGRRTKTLRLSLAGRLYHPWCARHFHYLEYLSRGSFENVMVTDTRDVVFQTSPSIVMRGTTGLSVSIESRTYTIGEEFWNSRWMKAVYGSKTLADIGKNPVSCAGVSFADADTMRGYLQHMTDEMLAFGVGTAWRASDQAVHNFLLWSGRLGDVHQMESLDSPIATLNAAAADDLGVDAGRLLNHDGSVVSVIHQYDRVHGLPERLTACAEFATTSGPGSNATNAAPVPATKPEG